MTTDPHATDQSEFEALWLRLIPDDKLIWKNGLPWSYYDDADRAFGFYRLGKDAGLEAATVNTDPLRTALRAAADRFREYALHHDRKPDPEKAQRNRDMAEMCEAALGEGT